MKNHSISKTLAAILLLACCLAGPNVFAHTPRTREANAVIQAIDYQTHTLNLAYAQQPGPQKLTWKSNTQFFRDAKPVTAAALKEGSEVTVFYHSPFFGKPFATKVILARMQ